MPDLSALDLARFWAKVQVCAPAACWPWLGKRDRDGYGKFDDRTASRVACELAHGPSALEACHTCDQPGCCNPAHLYWGTHAENMRDRQRRGRTAAGTRNGRAKLTPEQVTAIRARPDPHRSIAREFGVDPKTVRDIRRGEIWRVV